MDSIIREALFSEIMDVIEQVESIIDRYKVREECAFTFGFAAISDEMSEPSWQVLSKFLVEDEHELADIMAAMLKSFAINKSKEINEDNIDDIDLEDLGFSLN
jgi:hypothetical protein